MKIIAMMPARNEGWVLGLSLRAALRWCDEVVLGLHACEDDTNSILGSLPPDEALRVEVLTFTETDWPEMAHRQQLLEAARRRGATHLAIVDADEVLTSDLQPAIRQLIAATPTDSILSLPLYNLRGGVHQYHANGVWGKRWLSLAFVDDLQLGWTGDGYHHREPHGPLLAQYRPVRQGAGGVMHLWGASERRLRAKHAYYRLLEAARWPTKPRVAIEKLYSLATRDDGWVFAQVPAPWWEGYDLSCLRLDDEPWQETECLRLWMQQGPEMFEGLDLLGVAGLPLRSQS